MSSPATSIDTLRQQPGQPMVQPSAGLPMAAGEIAASAIAVQARATVLARYEMALRQPRNLDTVRQDLLRECRRPSFAHNKSAYYKKPIGDGVEGLGIRFVEVALRCMKNVLIESALVYEDDLKEVHKVVVTDLESNTTYPQDVKVSKTVERRKPADDGTYLSVRKNSYGKEVYTVLATDDDLLNKRAALISKAIRTLGLRIIPGWLQDEAEEIIKEVRLDDAARDPDEAKRRIIDAFGELSVTVEQLEEYLGHKIDLCQPQEIVDLRGYYGAIKDGQTTWHAITEAKRDGGAAPKTPPPGAKTAADLQRPGAAGAAEKPPADAAKSRPAPPPGRPVVTSTGRQITEIVYEPKLGEKIEAEGFSWRVIEIREDRVEVKPWENAPARHAGQRPAPQAEAEPAADGEEAEAIDDAQLLADITSAKSIEEIDEALKAGEKLPAEKLSILQAVAKTTKRRLETQVRGKPAAEAPRKSGRSLE